MKNIFWILILTVLYSCASKHELMRGSVAKRISDDLGIACIESTQIREGMKLVLFNNDCRQGSDSRGAIPSCSLVKGGMVQVTKILSKHYSEFKTLSEFKFTEGSVIKNSQE